MCEAILSAYQKNEEIMPPDVLKKLKRLNTYAQLKASNLLDTNSDKIKTLEIKKRLEGIAAKQQ